MFLRVVILLFSFSCFSAEFEFSVDNFQDLMLWKDIKNGNEDILTSVVDMHIPHEFKPVNSENILQNYMNDITFEELQNMSKSQKSTILASYPFYLASAYSRYIRSRIINGLNQLGGRYVLMANAIRNGGMISLSRLTRDFYGPMLQPNITSKIIGGTYDDFARMARSTDKAIRAAGLRGLRNYQYAMALNLRGALAVSKGMGYGKHLGTLFGRLLINNTGVRTITLLGNPYVAYAMTAWLIKDIADVAADSLDRMVDEDGYLPMPNWFSNWTGLDRIYANGLFGKIACHTRINSRDEFVTLDDESTKYNLREFTNMYYKDDSVRSEWDILGFQREACDKIEYVADVDDRVASLAYVPYDQIEEYSQLRSKLLENDKARNHYEKIYQNIVPNFKKISRIRENARVQFLGQNFNINYTNEDFAPGCGFSVSNVRYNSRNIGASFVVAPKFDEQQKLTQIVLTVPTDDHIDGAGIVFNYSDLENGKKGLLLSNYINYGSDSSLNTSAVLAKTKEDVNRNHAAKFYQNYMPVFMAVLPKVAEEFHQCF